MQPEVFVYEATPQRRWHTVVVVLPSGDNSKAILRKIVDRVGKTVGIKKQWHRLIVRHTRCDHRGYILVYEGEGSLEDRKRLQRAQRLAQRLTARVTLEQIKPWRRQFDFIVDPWDFAGRRLGFA